MPPITQRNLGENVTDYYSRTGYTGDSFGNVNTASTTGQVPPTSPSAPKTSTPAVISSDTAIKDVTSNQDKLKGIEAQALKIKEGLATLPPTQTPQQQDAASGSNNTFGYDMKGNRIANPNTGDNAFSADQVAQAGITDPVAEGLLYDAGRNIYYVPNGVSSEKLNVYNGVAGSVAQANDALGVEHDWAMTQRKAAITGSDAFLADSIANIMADYQGRKSELEKANASLLGSLTTTGNRYGTARYVPEVNKSLLGVEERAGIQKLADLATQAQGLVLQAKQAAQSGKFEMLSQYMGELDKKRTEQTAAAEKLATAKAKSEEERNKRLHQVSVDNSINGLLLQGMTDPKQILDMMNYDDNGNLVGDVTADEVKKALDNLTTTDPNAKNIYEIQKAAWESGKPKEVLAAIGKSRNATEAFQAAGEFIPKATGDLGDLQAINAERKAAGKPLIGVEEYFAEKRRYEEEKDAKKRAAELNFGGLNPKQSAIVTKINSEFENSPIAKNFVMVQEKLQNMRQNIGRGDGATDIAVIYDLMKSLDPTSVVREAEYNAGANKSGNIFAGTLARFNGTIDPDGGFISEGAKQNILEQIELRFGTATSQYENLKKNKLQQIKLNAGVQDPESYLTEFNYDLGTSPARIEKNIEATKKKVIDFGNANPSKRLEIKSLLTESDPALGRPLTYDEVKQLLNIP